MKDTLEERETDNTFDEHEVVASATDCTGLKLTPPLDDYEDVNESSLYSIHSGVDLKEKKCIRRRKEGRR